VSKRLEEIRIAYNDKHRKEKGLIIKTFTERFGVTDRTLRYKIDGHSPLTEEEEKFFLEELKLSQN